MFSTPAADDSTVTINAVPTAPAVPTVASTTQPTCAVGSGTIVFTAQAGVEYSVNNGTTYQALPTFAGLAPGTYNLRVRSIADNTCSTPAASTVTINAVPTAPAVPTVASTTQPTCAVGSGTIVFTAQAGVEYSVNNGTTYQALPTFAGLAPGTYNLRVRSIADNTCSTPAASTVTINAVPTAPAVPTVASTTQPTCAVGSGTIVFTAQAGVEYSVNNGTTYQALPTFAGLAPGTYNLRVRSIADNTCSTPAASTVTINAVPTAPAVPTVASTTQPTCAVGSGTIVFTAQAGVEYSVNNGTTYQALPTFAGLAPGTYNLRVRSIADNTCSTPAASTVTINAVPTAPAVPTVASTTQPTCAVGSGTIVFTAQAGVEYSVNNGTTYQALPTFAGLAPGTYNLRVRSIADNTCSTPAASTVTINAVPTAPAVPTVASTTQPTCAVGSGTIVFTAQAGVEYSVNNGTTYQALPTFAGLAPGTYNLRVRSIADNTCSTPAASTVTINAVPTAPAVPTVASTTQPTCAVGSGTIVFTAQAGVEYSVNNGTTYQALPTFAGLAPGTYNLRVRSIADNTCSTPAASTVTINAVPTAPAVPTVASTTQPTCAVGSGTIVFTAQAGVEYSVNNGTTYQALPTFAGLAPGTYNLRVRSIADNTCSTPAASTVTINAVPTAPAVPTVASTTQPTCAVGSGTIVFTAQAGVEYSVNNGTTYQALPTFAGLAPGTYNLRVRSIADNTCSTPAASTVTINAVPTAPAVPTVASTTQPTCAVGSGTIVFTAQAGVEYSVNNGTTYQALPTFAGLAPGTYNLRVRSIADNTCSTPAASTVTINAVPTAPAVPTVASTTQPTCAVGSGTIVFTAQAGVEYSVNNGTTYQALPTFAGLAPGTYNLRVRSIADNTCSTPAASTVTINAVPTAPAVPTVASTTQPTCAVGSGTIVFTAQAGVEYSVNNGTTYQALPTFAGLAPGTYNLRVRSIADNTCSTPAASTVTINAVPTAPAVPTVASTTQPTCAVGSGTIVFTAQAGVEYSVNNGTTYQALPTFAGLAPGTYNLRVRSIADNTCSTPAASTVTINAVPTAPAVPTVASTTQPTCAVGSGTIVFTAQAGVEYSVNNGTTYQALPTFAGLAPGTYNLRVRSIADNTCSTPAASTVTINAVPTAPAVPTVASTTQPTCAVGSGTIVFTAQAGVEYSVNNGTTYQALPTFAGLAPGTYNLRVRSIADNTCSTPAASTVTINAVPTAPAVPTVASTTQPTCAVGSGTIVFTAQAGVEYSVNNGTTYQALPTFAGLAPGTYTLRVRSIADNTCSTACGFNGNDQRSTRSTCSTGSEYYGTANLCGTNRYDRV